MEALRWLQEFMGLIVKLIPRPTIIKTTDGAVAFVRGKPRKIKSRHWCWNPPFRKDSESWEGRWLWYWPIWTEVYEIPLTYQPMPMPSQSVMVKHGNTTKTLGIDGRIEYQIIDAFEVLTKEYDVDGIVEAEVCHAVRGALWGQQMKDILHDADVLCEAAVEKANKELIPRGMKVIAVRLSVMAECKVIQVMGIEKQGDKVIMPVGEEE